MTVREKVIGILQPGYLPWLGFFDQVSSCDIFVLYDDVQFDKHGWRNRNKIKTANGEQWLTVPILHKGLGKQLIKDVKINDTNWPIRQIKTITQNYSKAPFFNIYSDCIFTCLNKKHKYLSDLTIDLIVVLCAFLNIKTQLIKSSALKLEGGRIQRLIQCIKHFNGTNFIEGNAGKAYISKEEFAKNDITLMYQKYKHPSYSQLYGEFIPNLSVIDLLFNCGDKSLKILKNERTFKK